MSFTPDAALDLLFPEELIPQHVKDELPSELHVCLPCQCHLPRLLFSPYGTVRIDTPPGLDRL